MAVCGSYLNLQHLSHLPVDRGQNLKAFGLVVPRRLIVCASMLDDITKGDFMLHYPYQVIQLRHPPYQRGGARPVRHRNQGYTIRVATNSAVVNSLIAAAAANKRVTVFVELKARFDEKNNLEMADRMKAAGIKIIYSIP